MKVKFFGGPIDGATVESPVSLPVLMEFPKDDQWGLWSGDPVTYVFSGVVGGPHGAGAQYRLKQEATKA